MRGDQPILEETTEYIQGSIQVKSRLPTRRNLFGATPPPKKAIAKSKSGKTYYILVQY